MILIVTGTDTGVGKTLATAALATLALDAGRSVAVIKPVQTGIGPADPDEVPDIDVVSRLTGDRPTCNEYVRLASPLAPDAAARLDGVALPPVREHAAPVAAAAQTHDLVLVEGAGGLLVRLDSADGTLLDLAEAVQAPLVVVTRPGLGTLNHTELTVRAAHAAGREVAGLVIGQAAPHPGLAEEANLHDLPAHTGVPIWGTLPPGAGDLSREDFTRQAPGWFCTPGLTRMWC